MFKAKQLEYWVKGGTTWKITCLFHSECSINPNNVELFLKCNHFLLKIGAKNISESVSA